MATAMAVAMRLEHDMDAMLTIKSAWLERGKAKFDDLFVGQHPELRRAAEAYARSYNGSFDYMVEMKAKALDAGRLTLSQARGVLNCAAAELRRAEEAPKPEMPDEAVPSVLSGTYTVVLGESDSAYVTLRLRNGDWAEGKPKGTQVIEYLAGPDNTLDFVGFGFVIGNQLQVWKRFAGNEKLATAASVLLELPTEVQGEAREAYAMRSGRCARCGRVLTVPASLHRGVGPECAKAMGW